MSNQNNLSVNNQKSDACKLKPHYTDDEIKSHIEAYKLLQQNTKPEKITVLYLDDEEDALKSFRVLFRSEFNIFITNSPSGAREILDNNEVNVIISDQCMPEETGVEFLSSITETHPNPIRILLTGYADIGVVVDAINLGQIYRYMSKPFGVESMRRMIENAGEVYNLRKSKERMSKEFIRATHQLEFMLKQKTSG